MRIFVELDLCELLQKFWSVPVDIKKQRSD